MEVPLHHLVAQGGWRQGSRAQGRISQLQAAEISFLSRMLGLREKPTLLREEEPEEVLSGLDASLLRFGEDPGLPPLNWASAP